MPEISHHLFSLSVYKEPWILIDLINILCSFILYHITHCGVDMQFTVAVQPFNLEAMSVKIYKNMDTPKNIRCSQFF